MKLCQREGCPCAATVAPKLCVPPQGHPATANNSVAVFVGLELCPRHAAELKPEQWLGPELSRQPRNARQVIRTLTRGRAPPDFERARFELVRLDSTEWQAAKRALDGGGA
jgi:hypothetical protein